MMINHQLIETVGPLDERYDLYFEDVEWCHRIQKHGLQIAYVPDARITHFGDQSLSKVREWAKKSEYRSALRYFQDYYPFPMWKQIILWWAALLGFLMRAFAFSTIWWSGHKRQFAGIYWRLSRWMLTKPHAAGYGVSPVRE